MLAKTREFLSGPVYSPVIASAPDYRLSWKYIQDGVRHVLPVSWLTSGHGHSVGLTLP